VPEFDLRTGIGHYVRSRRMTPDVTPRPGRLHGLSVLVIGARSGIGRAAAELAAREGPSILTVDLDARIVETADMIRTAGGVCGRWGRM